MYVNRIARACFPIVLLIVAGCAGSGVTASSPQSVAGVGAPVTAGIARGLARHATLRPAYPTKKSLLFEANLDNQSVNIYQTSALASNPPPIATLHTQSGCPDGLAMDKKGTLYVADECNGNDIEEFPKGSTTEKTAITGISDPSGLAIDKNGTLYVSTYPASIEEFPQGSTSPSQIITGQGLTDPFGLALDANDNLYVADFGAGTVYEIPFGTTNVENLALQGLDEPLGVAIDQKTKNLWVTNGSGNKITVYKLGTTTPIQTIAGNGFPYGASAQNKGKPRGTVVTSDITADAVYAFKSGSYTPYATLTNGVGEPIALLLAKP
jgi:DNA-binding beta-propeller fold protein YncE